MLPACGLLCTSEVVFLAANPVRLAPQCRLSSFGAGRGLPSAARLRGGADFREAVASGARAGRGLGSFPKMVGAAGDKYRACAGAVIFNREGLFLVGERIQGEGQWQFPQGGLDEGESPGDAARREVFEEIGLKVPDVIGDVKTLEDSCVYDVPEGTWLSRNGFKGQRMFWTLFFYPGEGLPPVDLSGLGGEKPEFKQVKWMPLPDIVQTVWAMKREAYVHLEKHATPVVQEYLSKL